jgi:hypothetical protein
MNHRDIIGKVPEPEKPRRPEREMRWLMPLLGWSIAVFSIVLIIILFARHVI